MDHLLTMKHYYPEVCNYIRPGSLESVYVTTIWMTWECSRGCAMSPKSKSKEVWFSFVLWWKMGENQQTTREFPGEIAQHKAIKLHRNCLKTSCSGQVGVQTSLQLRTVAGLENCLLFTIPSASWQLQSSFTRKNGVKCVVQTLSLQWVQTLKCGIRMFT